MVILYKIRNENQLKSASGGFEKPHEKRPKLDRKTHGKKPPKDKNHGNKPRLKVETVSQNAMFDAIARKYSNG